MSIHYSIVWRLFRSFLFSSQRLIAYLYSTIYMWRVFLHFTILMWILSLHHPDLWLFITLLGGWFFSILPFQPKGGQFISILQFICGVFFSVLQFLCGYFLSSTLPYGYSLHYWVAGFSLFCLFSPKVDSLSLFY